MPDREIHLLALLIASKLADTSTRLLAAILGCVPLLIVLLIVQRQIVDAVGAVK
ncbi:MAG TPA: hypothetical protein VFU07_09960 [Candidatus Lumbricidophila sp.]|nr:hypothetical protein [Candidatus Lumbricidophila sp.]